MLPKEQILANRLSIAMHDWPTEARTNMIEWVTDALEEQRETEREACAKIADGSATDYRSGSTHQDQAYASGIETASERIAEAIRARINA